MSDIRQFAWMQLPSVQRLYADTEPWELAVSYPLPVVVRARQRRLRRLWNTLKRKVKA